MFIKWEKLIKYGNMFTTYGFLFTVQYWKILYESADTAMLLNKMPLLRV